MRDSGRLTQASDVPDTEVPPDPSRPNPGALTAGELLGRLRVLESLLLRADVRSDPERLGALLHPDFVEVGASGAVYTRDEVLAEFQGAAPTYAVWAQDFTVRAVAPGTSLLLFRTAHVEADGRLSRHVARASLWQYVEGRWLLRFHQGTLTAPFERHET